MTELKTYKMAYSLAADALYDVKEKSACWVTDPENLSKDDLIDALEIVYSIAAAAIPVDLRNPHGANRAPDIIAALYAKREAEQAETEAKARADGRTFTLPNGWMTARLD